MGFNDRGLQLLSVILENQRRKNEPAEQRGHEINMLSLQHRKEAMRDDLMRSERRQERILSLTDQISSHLRTTGADVSGINLGFDSQHNELMENMGRSLSGRLQGERELTLLKQQRLSQLQNAEAALHRGRQFGQGVMPEFEQQWDGDRFIGVTQADNSFTTLAGFLNAGDIDGFASAIADTHSVDINNEFDTASERSAFVSGAREVISDRESVSRARAEAFNEGIGLSQSKSASRQAQVASSALDLDRSASIRANVSWIKEISDAYKNDGFAQLDRIVTPTILRLSQLSGVDLSRADRKLQTRTIDAIAETSHSGAERIGSGMYNLILEHRGFTGAQIDTTGELPKGMRDAKDFAFSFANAYQHSFSEIVNGLAINPASAYSSIELALKNFSDQYERAASVTPVGENPIVYGISEGIISPESTGQLMAFTHNPVILGGDGNLGTRYLQELSQSISMAEQISRITPSEIQVGLDKAFQSNAETKYINATSVLQQFFNEAVYHEGFEFAVSGQPEVEGDTALQRIERTEMRKRTQKILSEHEAEKEFVNKYRQYEKEFQEILHAERQGRRAASLQQIQERKAELERFLKENEDNYRNSEILRREEAIRKISREAMFR